MTRRVVIGFLVSAALAGGISAPAGAQEVRQGLNAPMILQMLARSVEKPESVMLEMLRPDAVKATPVRFDQPQVMPGGSVRYGTAGASVTITIRNPCQPGDVEQEMMALRSLPDRGRK